MAQISKNVFSKGLSRDNDPANISAYSMVDNINGRIMFNQRGTLDWVEDNGNSFSFTLDADSGGDPNRYIPIGYAGDGNIKVIFSVREDLAHSEIGILGTDSEGNGVYETLFNDQNDINNELLNFNPENQIAARFLYENDETIRVYWVDGVRTVAPRSNPPRVFTFEFDKSSTRNDVSAYLPVTSTVHSINSQAEFSPGIIKFIRSISGDVLTGVYQYTYRLLTNDGYVSPWTTPTKKIMVTSDAIDATNWNEYEMEGSGLNSGKGNEIEIKGVDERFDRIQVAYIYSATNTVVDETNIFVDTSIDSTIMTFSHSSNNGEPLLADEISSRFQGVAAAKTLEMKDDVLYYGNIIENLLKVTSDELEDVLSGLVVTPTFRDMRSDSLGLEPHTEPLVHSAPVSSGVVQKRMYNGELEDYNISNDYINYKGTQVENLFTGYFRGETYRFAIVFYDKLGYPYFAFHLADFKFPNQYDTDYSWSRLKLDGSVVNGSGSLGIAASPTNDYKYAPLSNDPVLQNDPLHTTDYSHLRIMGIDVSGIDITNIKDKISGFSIVRTDRDAQIVNQGLMLPTVIDASSGSVTRPHPVSFHRWDNIPTSPTISRDLFGIQDSGGGGSKFSSRPNLSMFYSPENDFDTSTIPVVQSADKLKVVGSCYKESNDEWTLDDIGGSFKNGCHMTYIANPGPSISPCVISKWYRSYNPYHENPANYFPEFGSTTDSIEYQLKAGIGVEIEDYEPGLDFHNGIKHTTDSFPTTEGIGTSSNTGYHGWGKPNSIIYKHGNFTGNNCSSAFFNYSGGTSSLSYGTGAGSLIVNYIRENLNPYGGLTISSVQNTVYYSTGHFQPIGNDDFTESVSNVYDSVEIYGGDCYLDYFGFLRIYGRYQSFGGDDLSYGVVFPYESTINHSMRQAASTTNPMYPDVGHKPWRQGGLAIPNYYAGGSVFDKGLFHETTSIKLEEEFNYNDVLTFSELNNFFNSQPFAFQNIDEFPVRWRHTLNKFYGDPIDSWRQFQTNDFKDLTGKYGAVTSSAFLFNQIYSWQETSFGRIRAFDRAALESETTDSLTTGIGPALDGIDYISTNVGNQHQWSLVNTGKGAYWIDVFNGKVMKFAQDGMAFLSDIRGMHNYFEKETKYFLNKDNPVIGNGISSTWDSKNREVLWTWNRNEYEEYVSDFAITSDVIGTSTFLANNETRFVDYQGAYSPTVGMIMPIGDIGFGLVNDNTTHYLSMSANSNPMSVRQRDASGTITFMFQALPDKHYFLFRASKDDNWSFIEVTKDKITPFRATVVYSEYVQAFSQFHSFKPNFYISHNKFVISEQADIVERDFYVHGRNLNVGNYYGEDNKSSLTVVVNDVNEFAKLFDNVRVATNQKGTDTLNRFIFATEKQNYYYDVQGDNRVRFLEDNLRLPIRRPEQKDRMRGRWLGMTLEFENTSNNPAKIDNFINHYRVSNRR